jgi:hypothetical protein
MEPHSTRQVSLELDELNESAHSTVSTNRHHAPSRDAPKALALPSTAQTLSTREPNVVWVCDVRKKGPYKDVVVSVRFPERIKRMMEQVAYSEGLDLSAWVRNLVIAELKRRGVLPEAVSAYGLEAAIERLGREGGGSEEGRESGEEGEGERASSAEWPAIGRVAQTPRGP